MNIYGGNVDNRFYGCDICHCRVDIFDWLFHCNAGLKEKHDFCLKCINLIITQHSELQVLLLDILKDSINDDCVEIIVTFVVGKVIQIQYN